jgi:UPF0755 protein
MRRNVIFIIAGVTFTLALYVIVQLYSPLRVKDKTLEIQIPSGATFRQAIEIFSKEGVIQNKNLIILISRVTGLDRKIRAGYYLVHSSMNVLDLLNALRRGKIVEYDITVIEGDSLREIAEKLNEKNIATKEEFFNISKDKIFLEAYEIEAPSIEGYIFPDTYKIPKGMNPQEAIGMMIDRMREQFTHNMYEKAESLRFSEREVLTLASIIEKEAIIDEERPIISAVYHNRLKKRIRLQADPTAIYGIKSFQEKITFNDLKRKTPYNTYLIKGLPPGPIASPSLKSIKAALFPADVPYIYFVSNNDGTHQFSVTAAEHLAAVRAYREKKQTEKEMLKESENNAKPDKQKKRQAS